MQVVTTPPGFTAAAADRLAVAAAPRAFNYGLATQDPNELSLLTHVGKLDGDIELRPDYFESLLSELRPQPASRHRRRRDPRGPRRGMAAAGQRARPRPRGAEALHARVPGGDRRHPRAARLGRDRPGPRPHERLRDPLLRSRPGASPSPHRQRRRPPSRARALGRGPLDPPPRPALDRDPGQQGRDQGAARRLRRSPTSTATAAPRCVVFRRSRSRVTASSSAPNSGAGWPKRCAGRSRWAVPRRPPKDERRTTPAAFFR